MNLRGGNQHYLSQGMVTALGFLLPTLLFAVFLIWSCQTLTIREVCSNLREQEAVSQGHRPASKVS